MACGDSASVRLCYPLKAAKGQVYTIGLGINRKRNVTRKGCRRGIWLSGMTNLHTVIERLTHLMFIKILDGSEARRESNAALFGGDDVRIPADWAT